MGLISLICTMCWFIQIVRWIISWALKKPDTAGRHNQDDFVEAADDRTVRRVMVRLEGKMDDEMAALENENSKLKTENIRLETNRLDGHFSDNNTPTTNSTMDEDNDVLERMKRFEKTIDYFSDEMTALKTQNPNLMATTEENTTSPSDDCLEALNKKMNQFYGNGSDLANEVKCLAENFEVLEERVNKIEGIFYEGLQSVGDVAIEKMNLLEENYISLDKRMNNIKDCTKTLTEKTTFLGKNFGTLEERVNDLKNQSITENYIELSMDKTTAANMYCKTLKNGMDDSQNHTEQDVIDEKNYSQEAEPEIDTIESDCCTKSSGSGEIGVLSTELSARALELTDIEEMDVTPPIREEPLDHDEPGIDEEIYGFQEAGSEIDTNE